MDQFQDNNSNRDLRAKLYIPSKATTYLLPIIPSTFKINKQQGSDYLFNKILSWLRTFIFPTKSYKLTGLFYLLALKYRVR
jgi:hypothetical protein